MLRGSACKNKGIILGFLNSTSAAVFCSGQEVLISIDISNTDCLQQNLIQLELDSNIPIQLYSRIPILDKSRIVTIYHTSTQFTNYQFFLELEF